MQSLVTKFLIISVLTLFFQSCKLYEPLSDGKVQLNEQIVVNPYFANPDLDYVYKAQIEVYGHDLSGLLVVKKITENTYRVVMTTDFGNKLIDFTINQHNTKVNYVVEDLNKKIILKILANDLKLLIQEKYIAKIERKNAEVKVLEVDEEAVKNYFYFKNDTNQLIKIIQSSKRKAKFAITFESKITNFAEQIFLEHYNLNINIKLKQIIK
ncbi:hypothetical protein [Flavobacterium oreochromis]|uniref:Uncharacterized protein n=1 Tax=Flavobacterium oreochromis TaxID=2906078 RepID=A0ABW8P5I9_9FLAO|nr:hypothetical protein [Flavobacterium oreochromis]